jgi:acetylornithine deacetylase
LSSYPDFATLQMERRTLPSETAAGALEEVQRILEELRREDPTFRGDARLMFGRPAYEVDLRHELPALLRSAVTRTAGRAPAFVGASFWADSAILGHAGIASVLFGPGGAGLHSTEEYVNVADVIVCRDALVDLARRFTEE